MASAPTLRFHPCRTSFNSFTSFVSFAARFLFSPIALGTKNARTFPSYYLSITLVISLTLTARPEAPERAMGRRNPEDAE
jgi:hypothetical protein